MQGGGGGDWRLEIGGCKSEVVSQKVTNLQPLASKTGRAPSGRALHSYGCRH